jgi:glycosyltransferase involved in cell wall biosynthesis
VVDFWDVGELANKILAVLRRAPLRNWLAEQGSREARGLSWTARASELERIFAEVGA